MHVRQPRRQRGEEGLTGPERGRPAGAQRHRLLLRPAGGGGGPAGRLGGRQRCGLLLRAPQPQDRLEAEGPLLHDRPTVDALARERGDHHPRPQGWHG